MAATKECPSCGTEVPTAATRCKVCFHDFTEEPPPKSSPLILLAAFAIMVLIAAAALGYAVMLPLEKRILVDEGTESIVFVTKYRTGEQTDRLPWSRIGKLEHVVTSDGRFELVAVDLDGERHLIEESSQPLRGNAERYGELMGKPVDYIDHTRGGFGIGPGEPASSGG